jgi:thiol-disulfide isomerase/thioredoxin
MTSPAHTSETSYQKSIEISSERQDALEYAEDFSAPQVALNAENNKFEIVNDFKLHTVIDNMKGDLLVLTWINPLCPFDKKIHEAGYAQKIKEAYKDSITLVYVNSSAPRKNGNLLTDKDAPKAYKESNANPDYIIVDEGSVDGAIGRQFDATTTPYVVIIDKNKHVIYRGAFDNNSGTKANAKTDYNYVMHFIDQYLKGEAFEQTHFIKSYGCSVKY